MAGSPGHWLLMASLLGVMGAPIPVLAQAGRTWIDPPAETGPKSPEPAPASAGHSPQTSAAPAASSPAQLPSSPVSAQFPKAKESAEAQAPSVASPRKEEASQQVKEKAETDSKVRRPSQAIRNASRNQKRDEQIARRREPRVEVSQARPPRNGLERRARITRYGSVQEGVDAGLEVMRLRTIELPDGRRITVLTRPNQDIASQLPDGYWLQEIDRSVGGRIGPSGF
jgi:hypothetical protein